MTQQQMWGPWGITQINLGGALAEQAYRTEGTESRRLLSEAVTAQLNARQIFTQEQAPQQWAANQINLGTDLKQLGIRTGGAEGAQLLGEAVKAYQDALQVYTARALPVDWALAQKGIGQVSYAALLLNQPQLAEGWSREVINAYLATPSALEFVGLFENRIYALLATSLLLQNRYPQAVEVYREHWNQPVDDAPTFGRAVLNDFDELEKRGVKHPDMDKLRAAFARS
jgi:hypothetical protein